MNLSYRYRLYPNTEQVERLDFLLWQGRNVWNGALEMWQDAKAVNGCDPSWMDLRDYWCAQRYVERETLGELPAKSVDELIRRLKKGYDNAYKRVERGEYTLRRDGSKNYGFPIFKNRKTFSGIGFAPTKSMHKSTSDGWGKFNQSTIGSVRVRLHRLLPEDAVIKWAQVTRSVEQWFVTYQIELPDPVVVHNGPAVGIDIGLVFALAQSDGMTVPVPQWYQDAQRDRRVLQRKLDRQRRANNPTCYNEDGTAIDGKRPANKSTRMRDTERQLAKLERHIANQRLYFWHVETDRLTRDYGLIAIEDLTLDFMIKNKRLAMSAHNAGFGVFWELLDYKATERGVEVVRVPPAYTSQTCAKCGAVDRENRKTQAEFICVSCGHTDNADVNAARNILNAALKGAVPALRSEIEAVGSKMLCEDQTDDALAAR